MTTRRQVLGYGSALAVAAPAAQALAQNVTQTSNFHASGLVGTLESATIATAVPTSFKEAPMLAELVKAGQAAAGGAAPARRAAGAEAAARASAATAAPGGAASSARRTARTATASTPPTSCCSGTPPAARSCPASPRAGR